MDWDSAYSAQFTRNVKYLTFESRPVTVFELRGSYQVTAPSSSLKPHELGAESDLTRWLDEVWPPTASNKYRSKYQQQQAKIPKPPGQTTWSLIVFAPRRAPANEFEQREESSAYSLFDVGLSETNFTRLITDYKLAKSFLHALGHDQSLYSFHHSETGSDAYSFLSFNIRTTPILLGDKAMTLRCDADAASTFVLLQGCSQEDLTTISLYLDTMQGYGGHPLLMVGLFMDMSHRQLRKYFIDLRTTYIVLFSETFETRQRASDEYSNVLQRASRLYESHLTVETELTALQLRLTRFLQSLKFVSDASYANDKQREYMTYYGGRTIDRLQGLSSDLEYLQKDCVTQKEGLQLLIASMDSIVALSESKISRQISVASKRDSTIMMGIAVGTMLFLPLTAMASIFAMPFLPWNVDEDGQVNGRPLLIYLTLSLPLTAVTLTLLIGWMWAVDYEAETSHLTLRPAAKARLARLAKPLSIFKLGRTNNAGHGPAGSAVKSA